MVDASTDFYKHVDNFAKFSHVGWRCVLGNEDLLSKVSVTISIPTYNRPDTLRDAIDSALNQENYDDYCVMVVDNDPLDGSEVEKLIKEYKSEKLLYYKNTENIGMFGNQNRCFEIPKSEYVVLLHDDDILLPNHLSKSIKLIKAYDIDYLQPLKMKWNERSTPREMIRIPPKTRHALRRVFDVDNYLCSLLGTPSSGFFRREAMIEVGGFNSDYYPTADYCTVIQLSQKFRVYKYSEVLAIYRVGKNTTMKQETLELFIHNDYYLRRQLFKKLDLSNWVEEVLLGYIVKRQYDSLKSCYNDSFVYDFKKLGIKKISRVVYLAVRLLTEVKIFFFKKINCIS